MERVNIKRYSNYRSCISTCANRTYNILTKLAAYILFLILLALWPEPEHTVDIVVAARDLGVGAVLTDADLTLRTLPTDQAPPDTVSDPAPLVGQTLAVARFQGEAVSPKHLGPPVSLGPDERAVAVRVKQDRGLAGLLRPGARVGVVATLPADQAPPDAVSDPGPNPGRGPLPGRDGEPQAPGTARESGAG